VQDKGAASEKGETGRDVSETGLQETRPHVWDGRKLSTVHVFQVGYWTILDRISIKMLTILSSQITVVIWMSQNC